jgi:hypothetical protein
MGTNLEVLADGRDEPRAGRRATSAVHQEQRQGRCGADCTTYDETAGSEGGMESWPSEGTLDMEAV